VEKRLLLLGMKTLFSRLRLKKEKKVRPQARAHPTLSRQCPEATHVDPLQG
jgi:hypothetical protein